MRIPKPTEADRAWFHSLLPDAPDVEVRPMFGNVGAFVNGNMFAGSFGSDVGVRLPPDDLAMLRSIEGAGPFGPAERPMGGWASLPQSFRAGSEGAVWVARAYAHVRPWPPKAAARSKPGPA